MSQLQQCLCLRYRPISCCRYSQQKPLVSVWQGGGWFLRQQEWLWRAHVNDCTHSSSTEGLESNGGKVKEGAHVRALLYIVCVVLVGSSREHLKLTPA